MYVVWIHRFCGMFSRKKTLHATSSRFIQAEWCFLVHTCGTFQGWISYGLAYCLCYLYALSLSLSMEELAYYVWYLCYLYVLSSLYLWSWMKREAKLSKFKSFSKQSIQFIGVECPKLCFVFPLNLLKALWSSWYFSLVLQVHFGSDWLVLFSTFTWSHLGEVW